jgi:hypothetical protein
LTSNAAIQASLLDTLTGNAATQAQVLDTLTSNAATQSISLTTLLSNAATQQTSLTDLVANAAAQAQAIANAAGTYGNANVDAYIGANIGTLYSNAATQATSINAITANIGSFYTYANLNYGTSSYANANVAGYLGSQNITSANIGGSQTYANTQVNTVNANLGAYQTFANLTFSTVANAATQATSINTVNANLGAYQTYGNLTFSTVANAASLAADITTLLANAATQASSITTLQTQVYANANVATYLPTYTGNIAGNIVKSGYTWTFSNTGTTTFPTGVRLSNARGANTVNFTTDIDKSFQIETQTSTTSRLWSFGTDGNLTLPQFANINFSNGVNILSTVAGTYGNTQVATYLLHFDGDIEFTSSTAKIGNVDVITVGDHIRSPAYQFSNGVSIFTGITGTYSNANVEAYIGGNIGAYQTYANATFSTSTYSNATANALLSSNTVSTISITGNISANNLNITGNIVDTGALTVITGSNGNIALAPNGTGVVTVSSNIIATGNVTAANFIGNIRLTGNVTGTTANVTLVAGAYSTVFDNTGNLTLSGNTFAVNYANGSPVDVVTRFESTWTVPTGNSTQSFTVDAANTYQMWVDCNIPNGILAWNATATVTNTNVPVVGAQYAWVYSGGGTPIDFTSIPNQFVGTANTIMRSNVSASITTNRFDFGINNTSGNTQVVRYGWIKIS